MGVDSRSICGRRRGLEGKEEPEKPGMPEEAEEDLEVSKDEEDCKESWKPLV